MSDPSTSDKIPTPPPLPLKPKRHAIKIPAKQQNPAMATVNNYMTFDFKEKDRFSGKDLRIKAILEDKELWGHVTGQTQRIIPVDAAHPTAAETREMNTWDKDDRKVRIIRMQALTTETMHHMLSTVTSKEAWDQIQSSYAARDTLALVMATQ